MIVKLYARLADLERARVEGDATIYVCTEKPFGDWVEITHPQQPAPLTDEAVRELVGECGLDWHRGYMPLFADDPTNRYEVLCRAIEAAHGIVPAPTTGENP